MPRKTDIYPTRYFRASDLPDDWTLTAQVETCRREEFDKGDGQQKTDKLVCYFKGHKSGLVVGPVVWDQIAEVMASNGVDKFNADDFDYWPNHWLQLFRDRTPFGREIVPCIRVRKPATLPSKAKTKKSKPGPKSDPDDPIDM
jgi:hypothetical protein